LLASALGVLQRTLASVRVKILARGRDWQMANADVQYAEKSLPPLTRALGLALTPTELEDLAEKSRSTKGTLEFQAVVFRFPPNPKLLTVKWTEDELERTANIITNRRQNFRLNMAVPIRLNPDTARYELARPAPRAKGRW